MWNYDASVSARVKHLHVNRLIRLSQVWTDSVQKSLQTKQRFFLFCFFIEKMNMAVSSTSLRERGEMLLSRVTADQEKVPWGEEGKPSSSRLGRILPPSVWRGFGGGSVGPADQKSRVTPLDQQSPAVSSPLLPATIMVMPQPKTSHLEDY